VRARARTLGSAGAARAGADPARAGRPPAEAVTDIDRRFRAVARALDLVTLTGANEPEIANARFLDFYSEEGIRAAIAAYGLDRRLADIGLANPDIVVTRDDPFRHRVELFCTGQRSDDARILDLRTHLVRIRVHASAPERAAHDALAIEWLTMQNPTRPFTVERPRLPGQRFPGTGLGRAMHNLLQIMAERIHRDAILVVPAHFHLARLYARAGYQCLSLDDHIELEHAATALRPLAFAAQAWAVERGCLVRAADDAPFVYRPASMILTLSAQLTDDLVRAAATLRATLVERLAPSFRLDRDRLVASLRADPVDGMDPDDLDAAWFRRA
jgi:hypothetical protein